MMSKIRESWIRRSLMVAALASAGYLGAGTLSAGEEGPYSCCGVEGCDMFLATAACPGGKEDCEGVEKNGTALPVCCVLKCNDPHEEG